MRARLAVYCGLPAIHDGGRGVGWRCTAACLRYTTMWRCVWRGGARLQNHPKALIFLKFVKHPQHSTLAWLPCPLRWVDVTDRQAQCSVSTALPGNCPANGLGNSSPWVSWVELPNPFTVQFHPTKPWRRKLPVQCLCRLGQILRSHHHRGEPAPHPHTPPHKPLHTPTNPPLGKFPAPTPAFPATKHWLGTPMTVSLNNLTSL